MRVTVYKTVYCLRTCIVNLKREIDLSFIPFIGLTLEFREGASEEVRRVVWDEEDGSLSVELHPDKTDYSWAEIVGQYGGWTVL